MLADEEDFLIGDLVTRHGERPDVLKELAQNELELIGEVVLKRLCVVSLGGMYLLVSSVPSSVFSWFEITHHREGQNGDHIAIRRIKIEGDNGIDIWSISVLLAVSRPILKLVNHQPRPLKRRRMSVQ